VDVHGVADRVDGEAGGGGNDQLVDQVAGVGPNDRRA
jgi:hypothetical protein